MPAIIEIKPDTLAINPTEADPSGDWPAEVWLAYTLHNVGDEDGSSVNFYITIEQADAGLLYSEFVDDEPIPVGESAMQYARIDTHVFPPWWGDFWITLRRNDGEGIGAILFVIKHP